MFTHPKLKRNEELILKRGKPIAERTFEGIPVPELHADPVETDIPSISNAIINASPSAPSNPQLKVFGRLFSEQPKKLTLGISLLIFLEIKIEQRNDKTFSHSVAHFLKKNQYEITEH
mgnify:CR=1 FL=1